ERVRYERGYDGDDGRAGKRHPVGRRKTGGVEVGQGARESQIRPDDTGDSDDPASRTDASGRLNPQQPYNHHQLSDQRGNESTLSRSRLAPVPAAIHGVARRVAGRGGEAGN